MTRIEQQIITAAIMIAALSNVGAARVARGQEEVVDDNLEPARVKNVAQFHVQANNVVVFNGGMANTVQQFEQLLFGRFGGAGVFRNKLDSALALRIDDVERSAGITDGQKKKLLLAGRGDIKRFFDKVEESKRRSVALSNPQFNNMWQDIQPLQVELNTGLFGDDSLFAKTVHRTLSEDQAAKYDQVLRQRKLARYQAAVGWFVIQVDKGLGLSHEQRQKFLDLIVKETKPPKRFGQNDYWFMMSQAARLPEAALRPLFDDVQWKLIARQFVQARGMRQFLESNGAVIDDDNAPAGNRPAIAIIPAMPLAPAAQIEEAARKEKATQKNKD